MSIQFSKYSGCGNDFILIDNRTSIFSTPLQSSFIEKLCHRRLGIGADGIILLENSNIADYRMRIFNADGSEAEMCGNGIRCLARFIQQLKIPTHSLSHPLIEKSPSASAKASPLDFHRLPHAGNMTLPIKMQPEGLSRRQNGTFQLEGGMTIEAMHQCYQVNLTKETVSVLMQQPIHCQYDCRIEIEDKFLTLHSLDTGVPHVVIFTNEIIDDHLLHLAPLIRYHPNFQPRGTNVNFAHILSKDSIFIRTYERGVEQETLACGTGAVAVAMAAAMIQGLSSPITIHTYSKDTLLITLLDSNELVMSGPAEMVFQGEIPLIYLYPGIHKNLNLELPLLG